MSVDSGEGATDLTRQFLAAGSVLLYLVAYLMTGAGAAAPVLFGVLGAIVGLGALCFVRSVPRVLAGAACQAVMVSYPVTFVSPGVFSDNFATAHFIAAMLCAGAFLMLVLRSASRIVPK